MCLRVPRGIMRISLIGRGGGIGRHAVLRGPWAFACVGSNPALGTKTIKPGSLKSGRRSQAVKAEVCKTSIRRFESARRLQINPSPLLRMSGGPYNPIQTLISTPFGPVAFQ